MLDKVGSFIIISAMDLPKLHQFASAKFFRTKKYLVIGFSVFTIFGTAGLVIGTLSDSDLAKKARDLEVKININPKDEAEAEKIATIFIIGAYALFTAFNILGIVGALYENFNCTLFAVCCQLLVTLEQIITAILVLEALNIASAVFSCFRSFIALLYLRNLYIIRLEKQAKEEEEMVRAYQMEGRSTDVETEIDDEVFCD